MGPRGLADWHRLMASESVAHALVDEMGVGEANYVLALSALAPVQHKDERMKWK